MSPDKNDALAEGLKKLMIAARPEMLRRLSVVQKAITALQNNSLTEAMRAEGFAEAHKLAGILGTYGMAEGSRASHELELMLEAPQNKHAAQMLELVEEVRKSIEA